MIGKYSTAEKKTAYQDEWSADCAEWAHSTLSVVCISIYSKPVIDSFVKVFLSN